MLRQQREAHEQPEEIREDDPLVREEPGQAREAGALREARERELVDRHRDQAADGDFQRVALEQRDAEEDQREEDEVEGDRPQHHGGVRRHGFDSSVEYSCAP
jgi:hypothetical protein